MADHEHCYVPVQSKWSIITSIGLLVTVLSLGTWFNDLIAGHKESHGLQTFFVDELIIVYMLFGWFSSVIRESRAELHSAQMNRSSHWGMSWFIFPEVIFSAVFFGVSFYAHHSAGSWFGGKGAKGMVHMLWSNLQYN